MLRHMRENMKTESTIFDDLNKSLNCTELIDNALGVLVNDPISIKNFALQILNMPMMIRDAFYWKKFFMFLSGVKSIQDELHESTLLSNKLFDNPKSKENNGMRLLFYIDKALQFFGKNCLLENMTPAKIEEYERRKK